MSRQDNFLSQILPSSPTGPVECLGLTFENDITRRSHFLGILRQKLQDPTFRQIEGFPVGSDEDILALSDPPYYTACPNPFLEDFISFHGKPYDPEQLYHREPFAADVSEGKTDPIYNAHSYHTKVPHKAIMRYILHYTEPGDLVLDGFCGTGMTGVAAQLCNNKNAVESLGYVVKDDGSIYDDGHLISKLGTRKALLADLSPAATFIASNYNVAIRDTSKLEQEIRAILADVEEELGWMYETLHTDGSTKGRVTDVVWSDVFICPECSHELIFWDVAVDKKLGEIKTSFSCPKCNTNLSKRSLERSWQTNYDDVTQKFISAGKQVPVYINYTVKGKKYGKVPDTTDYATLASINSAPIPYSYPVTRIDKDIDLWYERDYRSLGIYSIDKFYTRRNLWVLSALWSRAKSTKLPSLQHFFMFALTSMQVNLSRMNRWRPNVSFPYNPLSGTLYIGSLPVESNVFIGVSNKIKRLAKIFSELHLAGDFTLTTQSLTDIRQQPNSIDYIFTDPPFGSNIIYSDLSILWESWLKIFTNVASEAVVHRRKKVSAFKLNAYAQLMTDCFKRMYQALKPGRWITIEFHNSKNSVWVAIQEALESAGFVIADVRTLDKQQGSFKQVTAASAVKQDLIISAYKPNHGLEERFKLEAGSEEGAWDFVRTHLRQVPVFVNKGGRIEYVAERQNYLLYDRMVAFHVQRNQTVPLSAPEFYAGLAQRFAERDDMYFLPDQVVEYDKQRILAGEVLQIPLIVIDEASAIQWLRQALMNKPQTYSDLYPAFVNELRALSKHEKLPELSTLLDNNFLRYDGHENLPTQIHSFLTVNFKELGGLASDHPLLRAKAKDFWYVPDPNKAADLERVREKALLKEFDAYKHFAGKTLKLFRLEAVRAGFRKAWQEKDYPTIIQVAKKIPETVLQEDPKLTMWYDQALIRSGSEI